jgi:hypothetical protein
MPHQNCKRSKKLPKFSKLRHSCPDGKVRYPDVQAAKVGMRRIENSASRDLESQGFTLRAEKRHYFCVKCKGIHLTSKDEFELRLRKVAA